MGSVLYIGKVLVLEIVEEKSMLFEFTILNMIQDMRILVLDRIVLFITELANYIWYILIVALLVRRSSRKLGVVLALRGLK